MELRHFDKEDWFAYAGCETENPMIAYCRDFVFILDGEHTEIYREASSYMRTWTFPDCGAAMLFALSVMGTEPDHILDLKAEAAAGRLIGSSVGG